MDEGNSCIHLAGGCWSNFGFNGVHLQHSNLKRKDLRLLCDLDIDLSISVAFSGSALDDMGMGS